jgi:hypothetical protein
MNEKRLLDIYYYIDLNETYDIKYIEKYLEIYLKLYETSYKLNIFQNYKKNIHNIQHANYVQYNNDTIKRGLIIFNKMYKGLKMKNANDTWYIYISNGDIENVHKNVFVILINKTPSITKSLYMINRNKLCILKNDSEKLKKSNSNVLKNTLDHIFNSEKYINYSNLLE